LIDRDHREMEENFLDICNALAAGEDHARLARMMERAERFTRLHFAMEDCMMSAVCFPDGRTHQRSHEKLTHELRTTTNAFLHGKLEMRDSVALLLARHAEHIAEDDLRFGRWVNQTLPD
jgi:hemerythrin-like metal-binding protein